jgi:surfactin synthase thioesterase subunit/aryl carrier-like protein
VEGEKDMVAYLMAKEPLQIDQLQAHLAGMLPGYMVPNYYVQLETMPLTLNGKIDRKKLPVPTEGAMGSGVEMVAPRNETEQLLLDVWKEVLQKDKISVKDNFFHIGGHSLKGMKLLGILNRKHGFNLKVQDIYNQPTIELMAQQKESASGVFLLNQENVAIKNNIYFIPPIFGNSILFKPLAETLTGHFNCYGMQYSGLHKGEARYTSIEQAAEELSNEILLRQQDGNFIIFGFSMGATIAFEMAKILEKKFKAVNLILVDRSVETTAGILPGDTSVEDDVDWLLQRFPAAGAAHPGGEATLRPFLAHNIKLMKAYKQKGKIKGGIIALEAEDNKEKTNMKKWKSFTKGGLGQIFIKGDHWRAFLPVNFPYFHQAIGMLFPKK